MLAIVRVDPFEPVVEEWLEVRRVCEPTRQVSAQIHQAEARDPGARPELWLGRLAGAPVVAGFVDLVHDAFTVVDVLPTCRREGHGTAMARHLLDRSREVGLARAVGGVVVRRDEDRGALAFARRLGFSVSDRYAVWLQDLTRTRAPVGAADPRVSVWVDEPPRALMPERVRVQREFSLAAPSARDLVREWTPETLRDHLRGGDQGRHVIEAVATDGDRVVGFSTVVVDESRAQAQQRDTYVAPDARGQGLGLALKRAALRVVRRDCPWVTEIRTFVNVVNVPMERINAQLGYRRDATMVELVREL